MGTYLNPGADVLREGRAWYDGYRLLGWEGRVVEAHSCLIERL